MALRRHAVEAQVKNIELLMKAIDTETRPRQKQFITLCGRIFRDADPTYYPHADYRGRTIYLCTESCRGAFLADPQVFYEVHRNSEKGN